MSLVRKLPFYGGHTCSSLKVEFRIQVCFSQQELFCCQQSGDCALEVIMWMWQTAPKSSLCYKLLVQAEGAPQLKAKEKGCGVEREWVDSWTPGNLYWDLEMPQYVPCRMWQHQLGVGCTWVITCAAKADCRAQLAQPCGLCQGLLLSLSPTSRGVPATPRNTHTQTEFCFLYGKCLGVAECFLCQGPNFTDTEAHACKYIS